jgi:GTP-binding protein HflX
MNAMMDMSQRPDSKKVFEKDMLFATLDTSVRKVSLPDNKEFLLSDTVGFVSKLPHDLVKAFRSTLEEVRDADLLLHVADASNPNCAQQIRVTEETLKQIGAGEVPTIYVHNKAELTEMKIPYVRGNDIYISALKRVGLKELVQLISEKIFTQYVDCRMLIPYDQAKTTAYFNENAFIKAVSYENSGTLLTMECRQSDYNRYSDFLI